MRTYRPNRPYLVILSPGTPQALIVWTANAALQPSAREIRDAQAAAAARTEAK